MTAPTSARARARTRRAGRQGRRKHAAAPHALLAASPDVHACFSRRWVQDTYGLGPDDGLGCALEHAHAQFEASGLSVSSLLVALAESPHMATRTSTAGR